MTGKVQSSLYVSEKTKSAIMNVVYIHKPFKGLKGSAYYNVQ
jgi:hypothetical protein